VLTATSSAGGTPLRFATTSSAGGTPLRFATAIDDPGHQAAIGEAHRNARVLWRNRGDTT
jgi:hypothetical protein